MRLILILSLLFLSSCATYEVCTEGTPEYITACKRSSKLSEELRKVREQQRLNTRGY